MNEDCRKNEAPDYSKCEQKIATWWGKVEGRPGAVCTVPGDLAPIQGRVTTDANELTQAIGGNTVAGCGNAVLEPGEDCDFGDLNGETCATQGFAGGTLGCTACALDTSGCWNARFADNADGTITDNQTGLEWEKKTELGGGANLANLQDADNLYRWSGACSIATSKRCQPDAASEAACLAGVEGNPDGCSQCTGGEGVCTIGSPGVTVWEWLADLNTASFGGHADWRLATKAELESILDLDFTSWTPPVVDAAFHGASCGTGCTDVTDPLCSCTHSNYYWSASTYARIPYGAWVVYFNDGYVVAGDKPANSNAVRAVRGGS